MLNIYAAVEVTGMNLYRYFTAVCFFTKMIIYNPTVYKATVFCTD